LERLLVVLLAGQVLRVSVGGHHQRSGGREGQRPNHDSSHKNLPVHRSSARDVLPREKFSSSNLNREQFARLLYDDTDRQS
jgi:hypothetical protein